MAKTTTRRPAKRRSTKPLPAKTPAAPRKPRSESKQAKVIALLRRPGGATVQELMDATGWQPHTCRGVISGVLKKKLGLTIESKREGEVTTYQIVGAAGD